MDHDIEVIHTSKLAWAEHTHGERYEARRKQLGALGELLGCSLYEVAPGKAAWPMHHHFANEEAIFILSGQATLYVGESRKEFAMESGDYVALPRGDQRVAHQLVNTSTQVLQYLCVSTQHHPEIIGYPHSDKVGLMAGSAPGGPKQARLLSVFLDAKATRDYWDGE